MPVNPETAEMTTQKFENVQCAASRIAANAWTKESMSNLGANSAELPTGFGNLELFDDSKPLIAKVDAVMDRKAGMLTVTELDGNAHHKKGEVFKLRVFSGNDIYGAGYDGGQGADGRFDNLENHGPIPQGDYLIGDMYVPKEAAQAHPGGDNDWYKLYGDDGKGGYSYEKMANGRGGFNFHTGLRSNGCVTSPSEAQEGNANYPHSTKYEQFKEFLNSTSPLDYKNSTYRGKLHVK